MLRTLFASLIVAILSFSAGGAQASKVVITINKVQRFPAVLNRDSHANLLR